MVQPLGSADSSFKMHGQDIKIGVQPAMIEQAKQSCALGRIGSPDEAANAVLFMCSPLSDYVTGEVLIASGGFHF
jgi:3-oxoacyl-[acyl-carrier protein] reductase